MDDLAFDGVAEWDIMLWGCAEKTGLEEERAMALFTRWGYNNEAKYFNAVTISGFGTTLFDLAKQYMTCIA